MRRASLRWGVLAFVVAAILASAPSAAVAAPASTTSDASPWLGFWVPGATSNMSLLADLESQVGTRAAVVHFYYNDSGNFPADICQRIVDHGSVPLMTFDFYSTGTDGVSVINNGSQDAYIRRFADDAKAFGHEVLFRPFAEMNGNWNSWSGTTTGNTPAAVVAAWKRVHDIFAARGATNVKFVWCPNATSVPDTAANSIASYWPGDSYVDYAAMDGYNWGGAPWTSWQSFSQVFGSAYAKITALTTKPLLIAETASAEDGGNKAAWITDMFKTVPASFPRICGIVWFNENKERDWRIQSSSSSLAAYAAGVASWSRPPASSRVRRIAGSDRYQTAVAVSSSSFSSADTVVVATGLTYPDALAASSLAGALKAPILLVPGTSVPPAVSAEVSRLGARNVVIVGGTASVSGDVERTFAAAGLRVQRIAGADRWATAAALAHATLALTGGSADTVFVVRGDSFADGLSVSAVAYKMRFPVLLVRPQSAPEQTLAALRDLGPAHAVVVGDASAVSGSVEASVRGLVSDVTRLEGGDRYATSVAVASHASAAGWAGAKRVGLAVGTMFSDALAGGAACGEQGGVLLLTRPDALPSETLAFIGDNANAIEGVSIFGGPNSVSTGVEWAVSAVVP